jgi:hypothetical protein
MSYMVFSCRGQDYLSVPSAPRRLRRRAVEFYKETSVPRWLFKVGVQLATLGCIDRLVGREVASPVPKCPTFEFEAWLERVRHHLGVPDAQAVVSFPGQATRGRFYVNLVSPAGAALAFAKVSLDTKNDGQLQSEAHALRDLAAQPIRSFRVPRLLVADRFHAHAYLVMETMPAEARPVRARWEPVPRRCRDELVEISRHQRRLQDLSWWDRFRAKAPEVAPLAAAVEGHHDREVDVAWAHGDFTRRNICMVGREVWLFDWENSAPDAPVMTDEVRFFVNTQARWFGSRPAAVAQALRRRYLPDGDEEAKRALALALAFLCTCTRGALSYGRHWNGQA